MRKMRSEDKNTGDTPEEEVIKHQVTNQHSTENSINMRKYYLNFKKHWNPHRLNQEILKNTRDKYG